MLGKVLLITGGKVNMDFAEEYTASQEYDTVHHQAGKHIHLCHVQLTLFQNVGIEILVLRAHYVVQHLAVQAQMLHCILSKIFHSQTIYAEKGNT